MLSPPRLRRLMAEDSELSDLLLRAFLARRRRLSAEPAACVLPIIGSELDSEALALRTYAGIVVDTRIELRAATEAVRTRSNGSR